MIEKAKIRMPDARFIKEDFTKISHILYNEKFDFIIFTYSIHHLDYENQYALLKDIQNLLNENGTIIIGDVLFSNLKSFQANKTRYFKIWDEEEHYPIVMDYINNLQNHYVVSERLFTHCSGTISLKNKI